MNNRLIPSCYFTNTVIFVDDSREFLLNFIQEFDGTLPYKVYDSPYDALNLLLSIKQEADNFTQHCLCEHAEVEIWPLTNRTTSVELAAIHWEVYNPYRFNEISVVIVDYAMPGMNGLEFCQRLGNSPLKKILLIEQDDEEIAIKAVNEGIIDCFVQKTDADVNNLLTENILKLQQEYFFNMSNLVVSMLGINLPVCLQDPKFANFFHELCKKNNIVEYYLMEASGSFLLLDSFANLSYLVIKTEADLKLYYDLALNNNASQEILEKLKNGKEIPYLSTVDEWNDWSTCLYPAKKIQCDYLYYYALVKEPYYLDIRRNKIVSYHDYLKKVDSVSPATYTVARKSHFELTKEFD